VGKTIAKRERVMKRSYHIFLIGIIFIALALMSGCEVSGGETEAVEVQEDVFSKSEFMLGTIVSVKTFGGSESILDEAFERISEIENAMSVNIEESQVSELNRNAGVEPVKLSGDVLYVLGKSLHYSELSEGRFDTSIGPLVQLWAIGTEGAKVPEAASIEQRLKSVDYKNIEVSQENEEAYLKHGDMSVDLGSIAKGYAADEVARILRENKVERAIINLGGNVYAMGEKQNGASWRIGIQNPFDARSEYLGIVDVKDQNVVTSGVYERYYEQDGVRYHHILDVETGYPVRNSIMGVAIIAKKSIDADAMSTMVFAMGEEAGLEMVNRTEEVECIIITDQKKIIMSDGMGNKFELTNSEFEIQ